ncbi:hypothetical protein DFQ30_010337 [Apophysomyces sp. BC1015]|nr:hypothetical protein DFQ30_010337 [Apophysomyces sp. BC1015]KAG0183537.1 hypothetical protein DFQ29_002592 [Apophysomyces sp. BC1021]
MKIQSSLLVAYIFLFSIVLAATYPASIKFNGPEYDSATIIIPGQRKVLHVEFPFLKVQDPSSTGTFTAGTITTDDIDHLAGNYLVQLTDNNKDLQIVFFELVSGKAHLKFDGSSVIKYVFAAAGTGVVTVDHQ